MAGRIVVMAALVVLAQGCGRNPIRRMNDRLDGGLGGAGGATDARDDRDGTTGADLPRDQLIDLGPGDTRPDTPPADVPRDVLPDIMASDPPRDQPVDRPPDLIVMDGPPDRLPDAASDPGVPDQGPDSGCGPLNVREHCGSCEHDCTKLPNVALPYATQCLLGGVCQVYSWGCAAGFDHCSSNPDDGCETDLRRPETCGSCFLRCSEPTPVCTEFQGNRGCYPKCDAPQQLCWSACVDVKTDSANCGECGFNCAYLPGTLPVCEAGRCSKCIEGWGDCFADYPGCETFLQTVDHCGACGRKACDLPHVEAACVAGNAVCQDITCQTGYGNCDTASVDCERAWGSTPAGCFPRYLGTTSIGSEDPSSITIGGVALAPDGTIFVGGSFHGTVDFDPSDRADLHSGGMYYYDNAFITRLNADGTYGWTQTFGGATFAAVAALAVTPAGGVVATGSFNGTVDFDPGAGVDSRTSAGNGDPFVIRFDGAGAYQWTRTFPGRPNSDPAFGRRIVVGAAGELHVGGAFGPGRFDFDPGAGVAELSAATNTGFLVKLTAGGDFIGAASFDGRTSCQLSLEGLALAPDGGVWATGYFYGRCYLDPGVNLVERVATGGDAFVTKLGVSGAATGAWSLEGEGETNALAVTAAADGSAYVAGYFYGNTDFDPGAGKALRASAYYASSGFVLRLDAQGAFRWVQPVNNGAMNTIALAPDGGIIATGVVTRDYSYVMLEKINPDQTPVWTANIGSSDSSVVGLAVGPTGFVVVGNNLSWSDFDPGPAVDAIGWTPLYISRYAF